MKLLKLFALPLIVLTAALTLTACNDGPAEQAGEKIDNAATDAGNAIEDACEDAKEGVNAEDQDC